MGFAVWVELMLAPFALGFAALIHFCAGRLFSRPVRWWVEAAGYAAIAAVLLYGWGASYLFNFDIGETCELQHGQTFDAHNYAGESMWPLSDKCNDSFDLVPSYVNPGIVVLLAAIPVCLMVAVCVARARRRAAGKPGPGEAGALLT